MFRSRVGTRPRHADPLARRKGVPYSYGRTFRLLSYDIAGEQSHAVPHPGPHRHQVSPYALGRMMFGAGRQSRSRRLGPHHPQGARRRDQPRRHRRRDATATPRRSSARRSRAAATTSSSPPSSGARSATTPTSRAPRGAGSRTRSRTRCAACRPTTSTSTSSTGPTPTTDVEETLSALTDLVRAGKVRAVGSSTCRPPRSSRRSGWPSAAGCERFRTEQPPYSILNRGIEREVLPVAQRYGMGDARLGPARPGAAHRPRPQGAGRRPAARRGLPAPQRRAPARRRRAAGPARPGGGHADDPPGDGVRRSPTRASPARSSAPRTMEQLDDLLAGAEVDARRRVLDRIDEIVPPGTDVGTLDQAYPPPALTGPGPAPPP